MVQKRFYLIIFLFVFSMLAMGFSPQPNMTELSQSELRSIVTFRQMGVEDITLSTPFDSGRLLFGVPSTWEFTNGAALTLDFNVIFSGTDFGFVSETGQVYSATLEVTFNNNVIGLFLMNQSGPQSIVFPIPKEFFESQRDDGRHEVELVLRGEFSCEIDLDTTVVVSGLSSISLPYNLVAPEIDLTKLPRPFYQRSSLVVENILMVTPNNPSQTELEAAMIASTGLGNMTQSEIRFDFKTIGQTSPEDLSGNHLIMVGLPGNMPELQEYPLPLSVTGDRFGIDDAYNDDGIIQMAISPWNNSKIVLVISGNTEEGLIKAAKGFSAGGVFDINNQKNIALIEKVNPEIIEGATGIDQTFASLGYGTITKDNIGRNDIVYEFFIGPQQLYSNQAYVEINYRHSGLLDYDVSSMEVLLNGDELASIPLNTVTFGTKKAKIDFPSSSLTLGRNVLEIRLFLLPVDECSRFRSASLWATVWEDSLFHLPLSTGQDAVTRPVDLGVFPDFLFVKRSLGDLALIVPRDSSSTWNAAARFAYYLGDRGRVPLGELTTVFADEVSDEIKESRDMVIIGLSSVLPIIGDINSYLPAPFDIPTNYVSELGLTIVYRAFPGINLGYIELLQSPWNEEKIILTAMGSTDIGLEYAVNALTGVSEARGLGGDFAIVNEFQMETADSRISGQVSEGGMPSPTQPPSDSGEGTPESDAQTMAIPSWLIIGFAVIVILFVVIVIFSVRNRKK